MKEYDFSKHKFRCSALGYLMVDPKTKKAKEAGELSKSTQTHLKDIYISSVFGRSYEVYTKYMEKGHYAEEDSISLVTSLKDELLIKNQDPLENEYISGTPDIITKDLVIDVKTCWDMRTFMNKDEVEKLYYWQLQGYMWLTDKPKAELIYTLVNTPEHLVVQEKSRRAYQLGVMDSDPKAMREMEKQVELEMTFDDVDPKLRTRTFEVLRDNEQIEKLKSRIISARAYLPTLSLN